MRYRLAIAACLAALALPGAAAADDAKAKPSCDVPASVDFNDAPLPNLAARLKARAPVEIVVMGSGSSAGMGASSLAKAYPARLATDLAARIPGAQFTIDNLSRRGMLAIEMERRFKREVAAKKPALVIWQTGTVDAVRGIDVASFGQTLSNGIDALKAMGADVILMNMQYSPVTATALNSGRYLDYMRWLAQNHAAPLFDRYGIMKYWEESGAIDVTGGTKAEQGRDDDFVHGCIAELLAAMIANAAAPDMVSAPKP
ncbi:MAG TPA: SGNH/GDSL hydrolase family protein [Alphaproteobacteria bacterium]|nr:SGNH/GDSL hydrolase family protein [Alphaproteobacteria bacterium]